MVSAQPDHPQPDPKTQAPAGASLSVPRIGVIDFYGLHKVTEGVLRQALGVREGDPLPRSKGDAEEHLATVPGVVDSHLEAVCCDEGKMVLYVGIEEKGAPHFELRDDPAGDVKVPDEVADMFHKLQMTQPTASREDLTQGHALSANPDARAIQEQFPLIAKRYTGELRHVMKDSADEDQRAIAVYVIAYAPDQKAAIGDLQFALKDPDQSVRDNAVHGLQALAVYMRLHPDPDAGLKIEPTWFIEMLNSLSWTDRRDALDMLLDLTDTRNEATLEQIRERALPSLIEMARWKTLPHALPAFLLLGRVAGLTDEQVQEAWTRGDRDSVISQVTSKKRK